MLRTTALVSRSRAVIRGQSPTGTFVMAVLVIVFAIYILYPVVLIFINSFNVAERVRDPFVFSFDNWRAACSDASLFVALRNTFLVYFLYTSISFPVAIVIAWLLARTKMKFSYGLEFMFWVSFMLPGIAVTIGWTYMLDPLIGFLNQLIWKLPFLEKSIDGGPFSIYSVPGIIWAHLMANAISQEVMQLTPAFRNMDLTMEEAARVSGASNVRTMIRRDPAGDASLPSP